MDDSGQTPKQTVPASRKLGADDARELASKASKVIVLKGKKVTTFKVDGKPDKALVEAMLGPTGNLRAPTLVAGKTVLVGFNDEEYAAALL